MFFRIQEPIKNFSLISENITRSISNVYALLSPSFYVHSQTLGVNIRTFFILNFKVLLENKKKIKEYQVNNAEVYAERKKIDNFEQKPVVIDKKLSAEKKVKELKANEKIKKTMRKQNLNKKKQREQKMQR